MDSNQETIVQFKNKEQTELENELGEDASYFLEKTNEVLDYAFQPIVDIHKGTIYGYEAFLRRIEVLGFSEISDVFDKAVDLGVLFQFEILLREKAIQKFVQLPKTPKTKLFFNVDKRVLFSENFEKGMTLTLLEKYDVAPSSFCAEISGQNLFALEEAQQNLKYFKENNYHCAIDDFGAGYSGLRLLKDNDPDLIKIDRSFINNIANDKKSKLIVSTITGMAHVLGIFVVAECVETELELTVCKEIGCDLVQGHFICEPAMDVRSFKKEYLNTQTEGRRKSLSSDNDSEFILEKIEYRPPLRVDDTMVNVFEAFRRNKDITFFPVVDEGGEPLGIIQEKTIKEYTYSPYGKELIANKGTGLNIRKFLTSCPVADINSSAQSILEKYSLANDAEGIVIVRDFSYLGFLSASSLLQVINEKNLAMARDCSPLTKLPGNSSISEFVNAAINKTDESCSLVYLDLDNFKAFNDAYGFRQGDRAIMLFAELMQKHFKGKNAFLGHVGGDDFFIGIWSKHFDATEADVLNLLNNFKNDVVSFYDEKARKKGYLTGKDRQGNMTNFKLMSCSAALINLHSNRSKENPNHYELDNAIATLKKKAKASESHLAITEF